MKTTTRLLNLLTAFFAVIALCAAALVCFIVAYTQIAGGFSPKRMTDQSAVVDQANNNITDPFSFSTDLKDSSVFESLPDADIINNYNTTESMPLTADSTLNEIYEQPAFEYDASSTTAETDYTTDSETSDTSDSVIYTMPIEQGTFTTRPIEQNEPNAIYSSEIPIESSNQIINGSITTENKNNLNAYNTPETPVLAPTTDTVWLSETGTKYHSIDHCGRMNPDKASLVSREYAISIGCEPCEKCF